MSSAVWTMVDNILTHWQEKRDYATSKHTSEKLNFILIKYFVVAKIISSFKLLSHSGFVRRPLVLSVVFGALFIFIYIYIYRISNA